MSSKTTNNPSTSYAERVGGTHSRLPESAWPGIIPSLEIIPGTRYITIIEQSVYVRI